MTDSETPTETETDSDTDTDAQEQATDAGVTRRALLAAGLGGLVGSAAVTGVAQPSGAAPQGGIGTASDPVEAAYLAELRGPISDQGSPITSLVEMRAAEDSASISPGNNTLVFRYDPTTTV